MVGKGSVAKPLLTFAPWPVLDRSCHVETPLLQVDLQSCVQQYMASEDVDIAQLTGDQQSALQQYTSVTDQELSAAIPLLRRCEWNVQVCRLYCP